MKTIIKKVKGKEDKIIIFLLVIVAAIMIGAVGVDVFSNISSTEEGTSVDLSLDDRWSVSNERGDSGIFDRGEYLEIYNSQFSFTQSARLNFDPISEGYFKFRLKSPDLTKIKDFTLLLSSGDTRIFEVKRKGILTFAVYGISPRIAILDPLDTEWHTIEIEFILDGDTSQVSVKLDGTLVVDKLPFSTYITSVNNLLFAGARYKQVPNLTHLKLEKLISKS